MEIWTHCRCEEFGANVGDRHRTQCPIHVAVVLQMLGVPTDVADSIAKARRLNGVAYSGSEPKMSGIWYDGSVSIGWVL